MSDRLLIVGNPDVVHLGGHLFRAAASLGIPVRLCDSTRAFAGPRWRQRVEWWARGRRPIRLREFSESVLEQVRGWKPRWVIATGIAPVDRASLAAMSDLGVSRINVLTDDPWNPAHHARWFMDALPEYDRVYSPRRANLDDLGAWCGRPAHYLPFAYAPDVHFPQAPAAAAERQRFDADVMFAGGGDDDRIEVMSALIRAGLRVALYGGYWDRFAATRAHARGMLDAPGLRMATGAARVCICLVRRANRDGHAMRSFEVPAMRGCVLAEDTGDHRGLFGTSAAFFEDVDAAVEQARALVRDADRAARLADTAYRRITSGGHTYADRLAAMIGAASLDETVGASAVGAHP